MSLAEMGVLAKVSVVTVYPKQNQNNRTKAVTAVFDYFGQSLQTNGLF